MTSASDHPRNRSFVDGSLVEGEMNSSICKRLLYDLISQTVAKGVERGDDRSTILEEKRIDLGTTETIFGVFDKVKRGILKNQTQQEPLLFSDLERGTRNNVEYEFPIR